MLMRLTAIVTCIVLAPALALAQTASAPTADPQAAIIKLLRDPQTAQGVLAALRATGDKDLAPLYTALSNSQDKDWRLFGTDSLIEVVGKDAAPALSQRLKDDPSMIIRSEALLGLSALKLITKEQLAEAMKSPDEHLQCMAARAATTQNAELAKETFTKLAEARDQTTSLVARLSLLGMGRTEHLEALRKFVRDPAAPPEVLALLVDQIAEEKSASAAELAEYLSGPDQPIGLRLRAYRARAATSPNAADLLAKAIAGNSQTALQVPLVAMLAARDDSAAQLKELAKGDDTVGLLAKFELARTDGGDAAARAALEAATKAPHPVVIKHMLDAAGEDIKAKGKAADFYVKALEAILEIPKSDPDRMQPEHIRGARAATLLANLGTPAAMEVLKTHLADKNTAIARVTATGLLRSSNPATCDLMRPYLKSPYPELAADAALLLGRFGDADAKAPLSAIAAKPERNSKLLIVLANWYLLKIEKKTDAAAQALAKEVK